MMPYDFDRDSTAVTNSMETIAACRACRSSRLEPVVEFGAVPLADRLRMAEEIDAPEPRFPLTVLFCRNCSLVQLRETVAPEVLFGADYPYFSSFSSSWLDHCRNNAEELMRRKWLDSKSLVVEIASNDGYLLRNFAQRNIPVLGIDPAPGPADAAESVGVPTRRTFFTEQLGREMAQDGVRADVILANNVLAHIRDLRGFVTGIRHLLKRDGVAVIEVPYVRNLIERCEFDTIYHEHLCYFSVSALNRLFDDRRLVLQDVRRLATHGGSLRLYVKHNGRPTARVSRMLAEERRLGLHKRAFYAKFSQQIGRVRSELQASLDDLRKLHRRIAAYGAAAKGAMLLNACGIDDNTLDYVVDRNVHKQGRYMPGMKLRIDPPEKLLTDRPDHVLLLVWNLRNEILKQQHQYRCNGGTFIIPVPHCRMV